VAYKNEAFNLFTDLISSIWTDYARMIFNVQVNVETPNGGAAPVGQFAAAGSSTRAGRVSYSGGRSAVGAGALAAAAASAGVAEAPGADEGGEPQAAPVVQQRFVDEEHQLGRNDPCWCGSGKKFKKCHGA
jgi:preprotein translocase subunit SecA